MIARSAPVLPEELIKIGRLPVLAGNARLRGFNLLRKTGGILVTAIAEELL